MASVSLHTGILTSPKHAPLSDGAMRLWLHGLCWSKEHLTDGFIPSAMVPTLHRQAAKFIPELTRAAVPGKHPLWATTDGGYVIHDFADWQETSSVVQNRRRKWRAAKRGSDVPSTVDSTVDSTVESTSESHVESRDGSGSGSGRGSGSGGGGGVGIGAAAPSPHPTRPVPMPRDAHLGLIEAWNVEARQVPAWSVVATHGLPVGSLRRLNDALRSLPDLDAWEGRFRRAAQSSHLTGRNGKGFVADLWWLLEHVAELDAGRYDDRDASANQGDSAEAWVASMRAKLAGGAA